MCTRRYFLQLGSSGLTAVVVGTTATPEEITAVHNARRFHFVQIDVFASERLQGNPLVVFTDARGLSDLEMQAMARETNLQETTFVFPRDPAIENMHGVKVTHLHPRSGTAFCRASDARHGHGDSQSHPSREYTTGIRPAGSLGPESWKHSGGIHERRRGTCIRRNASKGPDLRADSRPRDRCRIDGHRVHGYQRRQIFKQPSGRSADAENLPNLSPNYYANLAAGMDSDFIRVYVDGLYGYVTDGKPVYPDYNDALHCAEVEPVKGVTIARGWDFGLTPACVFTQVLPDGRWIIFEELCGEDVGIHRFSDGVLELCEQRWPGFTFEDWGDPAGEQRTSMSRDRDEKTCLDVLNGKGIRIRGGEQNITARLESVRKPLNTLRNGRPQLQLHPRCEMLRKGFRGRYQFRRVRIAGSAERYHDTPDKNEYSHPHDALQYVGTAVFGGVVRGREEGQQGLKLTPLDKLYPEWAARMKKAMS